MQLTCQLLVYKPLAHYCYLQGNLACILKPNLDIAHNYYHILYINLAETKTKKDQQQLWFWAPETLFNKIYMIWQRWENQSEKFQEYF